MMSIADDLSTIVLAAGEPLLIEVQFRKADDSIPDASGRALTLSFYQGQRTALKAIEAEIVGANGSHVFRFIREGLFTEQLYAQAGGRPIVVELAERLRNGRNLIARGTMTVDTSADGVASLDSAAIGQTVTRLLIRSAAELGQRPIFRSVRLPYTPDGIPAPVWTARPTILTDGTPQVDETYTLASGTIVNGNVKLVQWLLDGAAIAGETGGTYKGRTTDIGKLLRARVVADGPGGESSEVTDAIIVTAAAASSPATVAITAATGSQAEGDTGTKTFTYTVTRSTTSGAVNVFWSFAAGSTDAADYPGGTLPTGGVVSLAAGVASGTFQVVTAGDTTVEPDESFTVTIAVPNGYTAGSAVSATGTILNDDSASSAGLTFDSASVTFDSGSRSWDGGTYTPPSASSAFVFSGPATITEGTPSSAASAFVFSGPATITEGDPASASAFTFAGPATITEGN